MNPLAALRRAAGAFGRSVRPRTIGYTVGTRPHGFMSRRPPGHIRGFKSRLPRRHPRIHRRGGRPTPTSANSSWRASAHRASAPAQHPPNSTGVRSWRGGGMLFDPQRTARAPPTDARHPCDWGRRRRRRVGGGGRAPPAPEVRPRAARVNAGRRAEVFAEVEQHVDHAHPHLLRRGCASRNIGDVLDKAHG
jgi:hypothetical protein